MQVASHGAWTRDLAKRAGPLFCTKAIHRIPVAAPRRVRAPESVRPQEPNSACMVAISVVCADSIVRARSMASEFSPSFCSVWAISIAPRWCSINAADGGRLHAVGDAVQPSPGPLEPASACT